MARPANVIGPNAILQLVPALSANGGPDLVSRIFEAAGCAHYLHSPPDRMVDESVVAKLFGELRRACDIAAVSHVSMDAGTRTAEYILANRIPKPAQTVLRCLPPALASRALAALIARHSWTFAGSGQFSVAYGSPLVLTIAGNPLAYGVVADDPACDWHSAVFQRLFAELGCPNARVTETACCAAGADACSFEVRPTG